MGESQCPFCGHIVSGFEHENFHAHRDGILQEAWNAIQAQIKTGPLPGNGGDKQAQRNGLILASNIVFSMMQRRDLAPSERTNVLNATEQN